MKILRKTHVWNTVSLMYTLGYITITIIYQHLATRPLECIAIQEKSLILFKTKKQLNFSFIKRKEVSNKKPANHSEGSSLNQI